MRRFDYLIAGGGVCGTMAAETVRKLSPDVSVAVVSREPHRLYSRILLPFFVLGKIADGKVFLRQPEQYAEKGIELVAGVEVVKLSPAAHEVTLSNGETVAYGKLIIATGADPLPLGLPGETLDGVVPFRTLADAEKIRERLASPGTSGARHAVVIGSSFIGLEFPPFFVKYGWVGHMLIRGDRIWRRVLSEEGSRMVEDELARNGIIVHRNAVPTAILGDGSVSAVKLADGSAIETGFVGYGVGLSGAPRFAIEAGLAGGSNGLETDDHLRTGAPDVWAAGDCVSYPDRDSGRRHRPANWLNAQEQGKYAAEDAVSGRAEPFRILSAYSMQIFGLPTSMIGDLTERDGSSWVARGPADNGSIARFHVRDGKIVGAALLGATVGRAAVVSLIKSRVDVSGALDKLADVGFDLDTLV